MELLQKYAKDHRSSVIVIVFAKLPVRFQIILIEFILN